MIKKIAYLILGNLVNSDRVIKTFITSTLGISNIYFLRNKEDYFAENLEFKREYEIKYKGESSI